MTGLNIINALRVLESLNYNEIHSNGDYYEGLFKSNKRSGQGQFVSKEGVIYEGQFKNDEQSGFGKET